MSFFALNHFNSFTRIDSCHCESEFRLSDFDSYASNFLDVCCRTTGHRRAKCQFTRYIKLSRIAIEYLRFFERSQRSHEREI
eukprot:jgi/Bigna1/64197/fgenesh1_kg.69_\